MTPDQQHREEQHAALMAVTFALNSVDQAYIRQTVAARWPLMNGAGVADILEHTTSYDMFLAETEPFYEKFASQLPDKCPATIFVLHALILLGRELSPAKVLAFLQRAGACDAPRYPHVEAGILNEDGSLSNSLLIMARAEHALRAGGVDEGTLTVFRLSVRRAGVPGYARNIGDIARWVTLVDKYTPLTGPKYDPIPDLAVVLLAAYDANYRSRTSPEHAHALTNLREHIGASSAAEAEEHLRMLIERS
jgi:hypothetical protein